MHMLRIPWHKQLNILGQALAAAPLIPWCFICLLPGPGSPSVMQQGVCPGAGEQGATGSFGTLNNKGNKMEHNEHGNTAIIKSSSQNNSALHCTLSLMLAVCWSSTMTASKLCNTCVRVHHG
jgi:hypothetical protein